MKTLILIVAAGVSLLASCKSPLDVGGNPVVTVEPKPPAVALKITMFGSGSHYSGSTLWNMDASGNSIAYAKIDTTRTDKPALWMQCAANTDAKGAESPQTGQEIAAALRAVRFRLDSLPLDSRGVNLIDSPDEKLGAEFIVDRITHTYDAGSKTWKKQFITDTIVPDGSFNAYATVRMTADPAQTLVPPARKALKFEIIFQIRVVLQEPKNIEPSQIFIRGTTGAEVQY